MYYWTEVNAIKFGDKVTVQGHGGITYAGTITIHSEEAYSTRCLVRLSSWWLFYIIVNK